MTNSREDCIKELVKLSRDCTREIESNNRILDQYLGMDMSEMTEDTLDNLVQLAKNSVKFAEQRAQIHDVLHDLDAFALAT